MLYEVGFGVVSFLIFLGLRTHSFSLSADDAEADHTQSDNNQAKDQSEHEAVIAAGRLECTNEAKFLRLDAS